MPGLYLIDTSALARSSHPEVQRVLGDCIADGVAARCVTVDLEAGYSGRNAQQIRETEQQRRHLYRLLPISEEAADRAREVQILLAEAGHHRAAGIVDLLTAAIAEQHGATVLHYDSDFEHIAAVTGQPHRWIVERGSID